MIAKGNAIFLHHGVGDGLSSRLEGNGDSTAAGINGHRLVAIRTAGVAVCKHPGVVDRNLVLISAGRHILKYLLVFAVPNCGHIVCGSSLRPLEACQTGSTGYRIGRRSRGLVRPRTAVPVNGIVIVGANSNITGIIPGIPVMCLVAGILTQDLHSGCIRRNVNLKYRAGIGVIEGIPFTFFAPLPYPGIKPCPVTAPASGGVQIDGSGLTCGENCGRHQAQNQHKCQAKAQYSF